MAEKNYPLSDVLGFVQKAATDAVNAAGSVGESVKEGIVSAANSVGSAVNDAASRVSSQTVKIADLNGDGKLEYVVDLAETEDNYSIVRCYLSEQDGTVYAYLQNYAPRELHIDSNGNLQMITDYDTSLHRLICDGNSDLLVKTVELARGESLEAVGIVIKVICFIKQIDKFL